MAWDDQNPPATDILLSLAPADRTYLHGRTVEVDRPDDGAYRVTQGNLHGHEEVGRGPDLAAILRAVNGLAWARNKAEAREAARAIRAMSPEPAPGEPEPPRPGM